MESEFDIDKLLNACQDAVSNPAAASKTNTEALLANADPRKAIPKTPPDEAAASKTSIEARPPWRAPRSTATAAKVSRNPAVRDPRLGPRQPATAPNPRLAIASKSKPLSSAAKATTVFPAVPPAARPVAPSKAGRVAAGVVAPPPAKANAPAKARPPEPPHIVVAGLLAELEAVDSCGAPAKAAAPAPAPVETPAPAEAHAPAAAPAKTAAQGVACPFKALGIPLPPPAVVRPVAALAAHVAPASEAVLAAAKKRHGPRGNNENSQWHTAMHFAKQQGPKALFEFFRDWPKPLKKQKTQPDA